MRLSLLSSLLVTTGLALAQAPIEKAEMLYRHRLIDDAKRVSIDVIFAAKAPEEVNQARMLLARIALQESRHHDALALWSDVAKSRPDSTEGKLATLLLGQWSNLTKAAEDTSGVDGVARSYFDAAEFWLGDATGRFRIDPSYIPREEAADYWLRKVVEQSPGTPQAELAMTLMVRNHIGVEGTGRYGLGGQGAWGIASEMQSDPVKPVRKSPSFDAEMAKAIQALEALQKGFPSSRAIPRLQFMVAHLYWFIDDRESAHPWLQKIIDASKDQETLWSQMAKLRLKHWRE